MTTTYVWRLRMSDQSGTTFYSNLFGLKEDAFDAADRIVTGDLTEWGSQQNSMYLQRYVNTAEESNVSQTLMAEIVL